METSKVMEGTESKVAFMSNLNGTTLTEVSLGSFLAPLCLLSRGLLILGFHLKNHVLPLRHSAHLLLDFALLVAPMVLSCTVLSDVLHWVVIGLAVTNACAIYLLYSNSNKSPASHQSVIDGFAHRHVESKLVPFLTAFRVLVNIKTAISILAVDFSVFPRRYAKTETYGTGVMDFGVGAYVMANAMVCPQARGKKVSLAKQLFSVWPLVVLGLARLASVKSTGYHEHVSEYGLHWNFFFTLAIVKVVASAILAVFPVSVSWLLALLIGGAYQVILETTDLKSFLVQDTGRDGFVQANKEGLFSTVGYVAVYMAGVQVGAYLMQNRTLVGDWMRVIRNLLLGSFGLCVALHACQTCIEPVSRRMANLPFCIWTVGQSLFFLSCLGLADVALLFAKVTSNFSAVSASWNLHWLSDVEQKIGNQLDALCLIRSVSRNQLLFFLLANVMTGLINILIDTLKCNDFFAVCVLLFYMFVNSLFVFVLHVKNITVKFW